MWIIPSNLPLSSRSALAFVDLKEDLKELSGPLTSSLMWRSKPSSLKTWSARWNRVFWLRRLFGRALAKVRFKTETEMAQGSDTRGNKNQSSSRSVIDDSGFVYFFDLNMPIFKGFDNVLFTVEICLEPSDNGILFWLESPQLKEIMDTQTSTIIQEELKSCEGFVVINQ